MESKIQFNWIIFRNNSDSQVKKKREKNPFHCLFEIDDLQKGIGRKKIDKMKDESLFKKDDRQDGAKIKNIDV